MNHYSSLVVLLTVFVTQSYSSSCFDDMFCHWSHGNEGHLRNILQRSSDILNHLNEKMNQKAVVMTLEGYLEAETTCSAICTANAKYNEKKGWSAGRAECYGKVCFRNCLLSKGYDLYDPSIGCTINE